MNFKLKNWLKESVDNELSLLANSFVSPIGEIVFVVNEKSLLFLDFVDENIKTKEKLINLEKFSKLPVTLGWNSVSASIKSELDLYFRGDLKNFTTTIQFDKTTPFQKLVLESLQKIPYGETRSYSEHACVCDKPNSVRAVANAIKYNNILIVIPCHRVIYKSGDNGHYSAGHERKAWLLRFERNTEK